MRDGNNNSHVELMNAPVPPHLLHDMTEEDRLHEDGPSQEGSDEVAVAEPVAVEVFAWPVCQTLLLRQGVEPVVASRQRLDAIVKTS